MNYKIPVFFHNLKGYDSHFLLHAMQHFDVCPSVIAQNSQRMIAFTARSFQFKDSLGFLNAGLDKLAKNLPADMMHHLPQNPSIPNDMSPERAIELLRKKGVYPYEYIDNLSRLQETQLPPKEAFFSG